MSRFILEKIQQAVCASHEVRVVSVDRGILDFKEVHDHVSRRGQALVQNDLHDVADPGLQLVEVSEFWHVYLDGDATELFVDLVSAVEGGLEESGDLLTHQDFEGTFRHEQTRRHSARILDGCLNFRLAQILEGVDRVDDFAEQFMEDIVDSRTTLKLYS